MNEQRTKVVFYYNERIIDESQPFNTYEECLDYISFKKRIFFLEDNMQVVNNLHKEPINEDDIISFLDENNIYCKLKTVYEEGFKPSIFIKFLGHSSWHIKRGVENIIHIYIRWDESHYEYVIDIKENKILEELKGSYEENPLLIKELKKYLNDHTFEYNRGFGLSQAIPKRGV